MKSVRIKEIHYGSGEIEYHVEIWDFWEGLKSNGFIAALLILPFIAIPYGIINYRGMFCKCWFNEIYSKEKAISYRNMIYIFHKRIVRERKLQKEERKHQKQQKKIVKIKYI